MAHLCMAICQPHSDSRSTAGRTHPFPALLILYSVSIMDALTQRGTQYGDMILHIS